ncbi:MAG: hypothetical protein QME59_08190, partial [Candidatus Hydrothermarchaeota archaeon]|nr:hypothetical protein [Candidatus Hydrothermarchaeota archaeon]
MISRIEKIEQEVHDLKTELISMKLGDGKKEAMKKAVANFVSASRKPKKIISESAVSIIREERRKR